MLRQAFLIGLLGLLTTLGANANDLPGSHFRAFSEVPTASQKVVIPQLITLQLTPKGEAFIAAQTETLVNNLGFSVREGYFPEIKWQADKALTFDEIAKQSPEAGKLLKNMKSIMETWFLGLKIQDPRMAVQLKGGNYNMSLSRLALVVDRAETRKLGLQQGAVLAIEATIDSLSFGADSILVTDINNKWIGLVGFKQPNILTTKQSPAIHLRLPFVVEFLPNQKISVRTLPGTTDIAKSKIEFRYGQMVVPNISLDINGQKFPLDKKRLVQEFENRKASLLTQIQGLLDKVIQGQLADVVNKKLAQALPEKIEEVQRMLPPGAPTPTTDPDFIWGLIPRKLQVTDQRLALELDGWIEDPLQVGKPFDSRWAAVAAPQTRALPDTAFDVALSVNRGMVNRVMQLSFERGYFKQIEVSPGQTLQMTRVPIIQLPKAGEMGVQKEAKIRIALAVAVPIEGMARFVLEKTARVSIEVLVRAAQAKTGKGMQLFLDSFDESTLIVPDSNFTPAGLLVKPMVMGIIKGQLRKTSSGWKKKPQALPGTLPLPPEFFGLPMTVSAMSSDASGHLVMYLNFRGNP